MPEAVVVGLIVSAGGAAFAFGRQARSAPRHRIERGRVVQVAKSCDEILLRLNGLDHRFGELDRRMVEVERSVAAAATEIRMAVGQHAETGPPLSSRRTTEGPR